MSESDLSSAEVHPHEHHHQVGLALMGFSPVGIVLGSVMTFGGCAQDAFLDGPSTLAIGFVTLGVGIAMRRTGSRGR